MRAREVFTQALWIVQGMGVDRIMDNGSITATLLTFINAALLDVATLRPESTAITEPILLTPGMRQTLPAKRQHRSSHDALTLLEILRNMGLDGESPGLAIPLADMALLREMVPYACEGYPIENYAYDRMVNNDVYFVYPAVPSDMDVWVEATYSAKPDPVCDPDDLLPVSDTYARALVHHMVAGMLAWDAEGSGAARAQHHMAQFNECMGVKTQTDASWPRTLRTTSGGAA